MPTHSMSPATSLKVIHLRKKLVEKLRFPKSGGQPSVYEDFIRQTGSIHVLIVWDELEGVESTVRSRLVLDAYEQYDPEKARRISVAMALTTDEAIDLGFFPFSVISLAKSGEVDQRKLRKALLDAGAVATAAGLQLRFRELGEAQHAYRRVQQILPGPFWALSQEQRVGA